MVAPTREIAVQSHTFMAGLAQRLSDDSGKPKLQCATFIGGLPVADDQQRLRRYDS